MSPTSTWWCSTGETSPPSSSLDVKLRLVPASASVGAAPAAVAEPAGAVVASTTYSGRTNRNPNGDGLPHEEYGCGD